MNTNERKLPEPRSTRDFIATRIREDIISGALKLGEQVHEKRYMEEFGVSRSPVREAVLKLASEGLIEVMPQKGSYVLRFTRDSLVNLCQVRLMFELSALKIAIAKDTTGLVRRLSEIVDQCESMAAGDAIDYGAYNVLDFEFHNTIIRGSENDFLWECYQTVASRSQLTRSRLPSEPSRVHHANKQHREIIALIKEKRFEALEVLLTDHVNSVLESLASNPEIVA